MRIVTSLTWFSLYFICQWAIAQPDFVPLRDEPKHVPKLVNDIVRVVEVNLPPDEETLFHEHALDIATLTLSGASLASRPLNGEPALFVLDAGQIGYTGNASAPEVHQIANVGDTAFRIIAVELLSVQGSEPSGAGQREAPYELELENERIRIWRLTLDPGESNTLDSLKLPILRVVEMGGSVGTDSEAGQRDEIELRMGQMRWLESGASVGLTNVGDAPIVIVDFEIR